MGYRMKTKPASMRVDKAKPENTEEHTCRECCIGEWNTDCFNYRGEPFQIYCEHSTFAYSRRRGCNTCLDNTPACEYFKAGERQSWKTKGGTK